MVEYALLLAGTSLGTFATTVTTFVSGVDWTLLSYALLGLVGLRIAFWAFTRPS